MSGDLRLDLAHAGKRSVPAEFQLRSDETILWIGGVVLPEGPVGVVARGLQVAHQRATDLVASTDSLRLGLNGRRDRAWLDDL